MKRNVIEVLRASTDAQDLRRQAVDLERNRAAYGLTVARTVELEGVSGRKVLSNADMRRVLADLSDPAIDGISISALDRLFRMERYSDYSILDPFKDTGKMIWSAKEGALDLRTDAGLIISLMSGAQGALEWRELRRRTAGGKELLRQAGGCPNGRRALPRGVGFEAIKDSKGRSIGAKWFYEEPDAARIRRAYDLLFQGLSWRSIAREVGGGFTYNGVRHSLRNPIWMGIRRYSEGRETPLEVKVIEKPLITPARWEQAQAIILGRRDRWSKSKRPPRFLLSSLLTCACGKPIYLRCGSNKQRHYYYCSTGFPGHGPKCSHKPVQQEQADRLMEEIVETRLLDAAFLRKLLAKLPSRQHARDRQAGKLDGQREKLEAERQRLLRMTLKATISEADYTRESKRIEAEMRDLDRLVPAPAPAAAHVGKIIARLTSAFSRFAKQPFQEKRDLLKAAFKEITLSNGCIAAITVNGVFLDSANSLPRCSASCTTSCCGRYRIRVRSGWSSCKSRAAAVAESPPLRRGRTWIGAGSNAPSRRWGRRKRGAPR
jgi:DNA invertase Pin-like site-specific DNA recombinase